MSEKNMKELINKGKEIIKKCEQNDIPYFVLSGHDRCTIGAMIKYIDGLYCEGCSAKMIAEVTQILAAFKLHQYQYGNKIPD